MIQLRNAVNSSFRLNLIALSLWTCFITQAMTAHAEPAKQSDISAAAEQSSSADEIPLEQLQNFANVINTIKHYYVKPVKDQELFDNAIRGMLSGLDPHSGYLDKAEFEDLKTSTTGKFGGLGIEVTMEDGFVKVISPIDDTPAFKAGVKSGDLIVKIDKTPVKGLALKDAVELMRGTPGSEIALLVIRQNKPAPLEFKMQRDIIKIKSVKSEVIHDNFGYIRISQFQADTDENVANAIKNIKSKVKDNKLYGIVLDLRNNPGGILNGAIKVSELFLDSSKSKQNMVIVSTKGRMEDVDSNAYSKGTDVTGGIPLVVLVNKGSASASEIVAGALQDHKRAIIMGTTSFGKGSVQTVIPLKGDTGLKLTTALYYTPGGRSIQATGIVPDIIVDDLQIKQRDDQKKFGEISEADLKDHLLNGNTSDKDKANEKKDNVFQELLNKYKKSDDKSTNQQESKSSESPTLDSTNKNIDTTKNKDSKEDDKKVTLAEEDYQLNEAINVLKGLNMMVKN